MIKLNIQNLLNERQKTRYWLMKQLDCNYQTILRLCGEESSAIYLDTIEKLCKVFDCTPNDLFVIED
ncbi:MAG: helix-turn-helix transcriptional regulator [Oscillospiraceae bacterium]|jgi:putative transcriptional regulator|nr:helix-turn-helix transcriptional regulator [Oscillospiraceae bacterium]